MWHLKVVRRKPGVLVQAELDELCRLYERHLEEGSDISAEMFQNLDSVVLIYNRKRELKGCIGLNIYHEFYGGKKICLIHTSLVALDRDIRGAMIVQRVGLADWFYLWFRYPGRPIYWLFTASTLQGFMIMANYLKEFWPHPDTPMTVNMQELRRRLTRRLGKNLNIDEERYTVYLSRVWRPARKQPDLSNKYVAYFQEHNPHPESGASLVCVSPLSVKNALHAVLATGARLCHRLGGGVHAQRPHCNAQVIRPPQPTPENELKRVAGKE